jgi:hypothetical protein
MNAHSETFWQKVIKELKSIAWVSLYFFVWFAVLMFLKKMILKDYNIEFSGISIAVISALVMAKVVLLLELIKPITWVKRQPAIVDVLIRTFLYSIGVLIVQVMEKGFELRHEEGGFINAMTNIFQHPDMNKVWAGTLIIGISLFFYNVYAVLKPYLRGNKFVKILFNTPLENIPSDSAPGIE